MFGPIRMVVFDFDGTLVDTMSHVVESIVYAVKKVKNIDVSPQEVQSKFVPSMREILSLWFENDSEKSLAIEAWKEYQGSSYSWAKPFSRVEEMLLGIQKTPVKMCIFTGRNREPVVEILREHAWLGKFFKEDHLVCGDDGFQPKPSGEGLLALCKKFNVAPQDTIFVGDHNHDLLAGRDAGTKTALVLWDMSTKGKKNERSHFRDLWSNASDALSDLRLSDPAGLTAWLKASDLPTVKD